MAGYLWLPHLLVIGPIIRYITSSATSAFRPARAFLIVTGLQGFLQQCVHAVCISFTGQGFLTLWDALTLAVKKAG